jgi:hypothetical protein
MRFASSFLFVLLAACASKSDPATTEAPLSGRPSAAFLDRTVPVCWEDASSFAEERELVRTSVASTWGAVPSAHIEFVGWEQCQPGEKAVRIQIARARAYAHAFGEYLLGKQNGLTLNFTYGPEFAPGCAATDRIRKSCIVVDAVHEFGHVLAFSHEQNRDDLPPTSGCTLDQLAAGADDPDAPPETATIAESTLDTMYDPTSVMNYCNPVYWNRHKPAYARFDATHPWSLSAADRDGMKVMYPASCPDGDGLYCGGHGIGGSSSVLYNCHAGSLESAAQCALGCEPMPSGEADRCAAR